MGNPTSSGLVGPGYLMAWTGTAPGPPIPPGRLVSVDSMTVTQGKTDVILMPEPTSVALTGIGLVILLGWHLLRRRRH